MEYYPPPPLPKKDNTWIKVVIAGIGCLSLVIGISAFLISKFYFSFRAPTRTIEEHLQAINEGNYELAYSKFSDDYRREFTYRKFRQDMEEFSSWLPSRDSTFRNIKIANDKASVAGTLTGRDGAIFPVQYQLIKENGIWKISMYHWTSPGDTIKI